MRKFKVTIEGKSYEVEVEEIKTGAPGRGITANRRTVNRRAPQVNRQVSTTQKETPVAETTPAETTPAANVESGNGEKVLAPLPGTISIVVKEGDTVSSGDVLFVLEAMKMENEITAPVGGTVSSIAVTEGATVDTGELLAEIV